MTYNVFGGTLNLTQPARCIGSRPQLNILGLQVTGP